MKRRSFIQVALAVVVAPFLPQKNDIVFMEDDRCYNLYAGEKLPCSWYDAEEKAVCVSLQDGSLVAFDKEANELQIIDSNSNKCIYDFANKDWKAIVDGYPCYGKITDFEMAIYDGKFNEQFYRLVKHPDKYICQVRDDGSIGFTTNLFSEIA